MNTRLTIFNETNNLFQQWEIPSSIKSIHGELAKSYLDGYGIFFQTNKGEVVFIGPELLRKCIVELK